MNTDIKKPTSRRERWIGLAHVRPWAGNDQLGGAEAAVVAVVGDAEDQAAFLALVESGFYDRQFEVVSLEDVEPLALRKTRHQLSAELSATIAALSSDSLLAFGTFHTYKRYVGPVNHIPIVEPKP